MFDNAPAPTPSPAPAPKFFYGHGPRKAHLLETHADCGLMREGRYYSLCKCWWTLNPTRTDALPPGLPVCKLCRIEAVRRGIWKKPEPQPQPQPQPQPHPHPLPQPTTTVPGGGVTLQSGMFAEVSFHSNSVLVHAANGHFWLRMQSSANVTEADRQKFAQRLADLINEHVNLGEY